MNVILMILWICEDFSIFRPKGPLILLILIL
jgi:hypothetical protein